MNNKVYRLLRNNKEQGPFTSEELIVSGLKPYDLIWVDGRSAAWSYPGEMNEFKNYVSNPDEYRNNLIVKKQESASRISSTVQAAVTVNDNLVQAGISKQKPRYKVSAAWSKIQTITTQTHANSLGAETKKSSPTKLIEASAHEPVTTKSLSWEQAWRDWENEKSTVPQVKTQAVSTIKSETKKIIHEKVKAEPVLEKKFEQSLDTITNNYIDSLLLQKKKAKKFSAGKLSEFVLPSVALIIIFSVGYWFLHDTKTAAIVAAPVKQVASANPSTPVLNTNNVDENNKNESNQNIHQPTQKSVSITNEAEAKEKVIAHNNNTKLIAPVATNTLTNNVASNKNDAVNNGITSNADAKKNDASNTKQFDPSVINNVPKDNAYNDPVSNNNGDLNAVENRPVRRRTNGADISASPSSANNTAVTKTAKVNSALSYVNVPEYVTMNNGNGSVKIQNISDVDLDLVVVDVQYFDGSSRYRKGETLYLHNLKAGKSVTVKTPRDINSAYATSKVSMVSSDANNVYAVGDN